MHFKTLTLLELSLLLVYSIAGSKEDFIASFANISIQPGSYISLVDKFFLESRQEPVCEIPGGPICSSTTCCPPGDHCCSPGCCPDTDSCFGENMCCPLDAQICGGTACCKPNSVCCQSTCCPPGSTCCGDTCCLEGETCERNTCIDATLVSSGRVARFELDEEKNGCLLVNMCNGMQGENTRELTYSGKLSASAKKTKRRNAGCVSGYCRGLAQPGLDSCDEFPPAMSDEGGNATSELLRVTNCIPGVQNSRQGSAFGNMVKKSGIKAGDKFIISIDCDEVLGPNSSPCPSMLSTRDVIQSTGVTTSGNLYPPQLVGNGTLSELILPFGDLGPGTYNATIQVISGSVIGSYVTDNLGTNLTSSDVTTPMGQIQHFNFSIEEGGELMGVGLILGIKDNSTNITWTFQGQDLPAGSNSSNNTGSTSDPSNGTPLKPAGFSFAMAVGMYTSLLLTIL